MSAQDATYLISPAWFEQITPAASAPADETPAKSDSAKGDRSSQWIVQFTSEALSDLGSIYDSRSLLRGGPRFELVHGLGRVGQVLISTDGDADSTSKWLAANPHVQYFERNENIWSIDVVPNDSNLGDLWGMNNTGQTGGASDSDIDAPEAWDVTTGSASVVVGIIDTGVDYNHPDLAANIWTNPGEVAGNGVDDDGNGFVDDIHGYDFVNNDGDPIDDHAHGTHVAGTIAGVGNNGSGVVGVNWTSSVMALKFLDAGGSGSTANAVRAVNYATLMRQQYGVNIRVTNNSWEGGGFSQALRDAINAGENAGILFVAAAGNDESNNDTSPSYPASYDVPSILSVAATNHLDILARFSNYGVTSVDLAAPGVDILSTLPNNGYGKLSGTSMAAPHVAGVAALAWALSPTSSVTEIRDAILDGADSVAGLAGRVLTGGRLNARGTLERLGMNVAATTPASRSAVAVPPTLFEVSFTHRFDSQTLQASDFSVNGVSANTVTIVDDDTAAFAFAASPVTVEGPQTMQMSQGAVARLSDADPLRAWQSMFYFDTVTTAVVSSDPAQGATLPARPAAIVLTFNEPIDPASVGVEDLQLDYGIVISATAQAAKVIRFEVRELIEDGSVKYELKAGAILDVHGNPAAAHEGEFNIDVSLINHYRSSNVPRSINDFATVTSVITIPTAVTIADVEVGLDISHTYDENLEVVLVAPNGTRVELFTGVGGAGANFVGTVLDDEASTAIQTGGAPFTGRFRPEGRLSDLDGLDTVGTWTLEIRDHAGADVGTLNAWELIITQAADIPPRIDAVAPLPSDHGRTWREIDVLSVHFSEGMQPATVNAANWELREAGIDEAFDTPDDVIIGLATSPVYAGGLTAELAIQQGPLPPGSYRFTATNHLLDLTGNQLDGNGDRTEGDAYVRHFTVVIVPADRFEPNDAFLQATDLGELGSRTETNLSIHTANNDDYYLFTASITGVLSAEVFFSHAEGDLDVALYGANRKLLESSVSSDDNERLIRSVMAGKSYYLRVYGNGGALSPSYILQLVVSQTPSEDRFEPNDTFARARNLGSLSARTEDELSIHFPDNDDYYRFKPTITGTFSADVQFSHAAGDIDMELYDADQTRLTYSDSRNNDERIVWNVVAGQTYYLRVLGYAGAMNPDYTLQLLVSQAPVADRFEPNDSFSAASDLGSLASRTEASLSIHEENNDDYFRFTAAVTGLLKGEVLLSNAAGDIDVALYDENQDYLTSSESHNDIERIVWSVAAGQTYYLHVYGYAGAINADYSVQLVVSEALTADRFEPNDTFSQATNLGVLGSRSETNVSIHFPDNSDYYRFMPGGTGLFIIDVSFRHEDGNIDMALYDSDQMLLKESTSDSNNERIEFQVVAGETYYLRIYGVAGDTNPNYMISATVGAQGTPANDLIYLKGTSDGASIEVYDAFPPQPSALPLLVWPMNASVPLTINTFDGDDRVLIELPAGVSGPVAGILLDTGAGNNNQLEIVSGSVRIDSVSTGGALTTMVFAGARLATRRLMQNGVILGDNSQVTLLLNGATSRVTSLSVGANATLDITNNVLVLDYAGDSPASAIRQEIFAGRGGAGLGRKWNGAGITSSTVAQANASAPESRSLGYAENALLPLGAYTTFRGQAVDATSILIAYTRTGDANLNGVVNDDDVTVLGTSYAPGAANAAWAFGDFEYNGFVDDDDVTLLGTFYNPAASPAPAPAPLAATSPRLRAAGEVRWAESDEAEVASGKSIGGAQANAQSSLASINAWEAIPAARDFPVRRFSTEAGHLGDRDNQQDELIGLLAESIAARRATQPLNLGNSRLAHRKLNVVPPRW